MVFCQVPHSSKNLRTKYNSYLKLYRNIYIYTFYIIYKRLIIKSILHICLENSGTTTNNIKINFDTSVI